MTRNTAGEAGGAGGLTDARGCLSSADLRVVRDAPPGQAPAHLVGHLAGCDRCQTRLLRSDPESLPRKPGSTPGAALLRLLLVVVAIVAAVLGLFALARQY